jgi:hypothetical protein
MELTNEKIWLYGLLIACPEGKPLPDCPLEKYRNRTLKERLSILESFTAEEVDEIIKHHHQCVLRRL